MLITAYFLVFSGNEKFRDPSNSNGLIDARRRKMIPGDKMKSLRISVATTFTFLACRTPYYVLMILSIFIHKTVIPGSIKFILSLFSIMHEGLVGSTGKRRAESRGIFLCPATEDEKFGTVSQY